MAKTKPRVLVVEDDPSFSTLLAIELKKQGFEVLSASKGCLSIRLTTLARVLTKRCRRWLKRKMLSLCWRSASL